MYLCHSGFVNALHSLYTRINRLFKQILAQGKNESVENKKGNNLSTKDEQENLERLGGNDLSRQGQSKTPTTKKGTKSPIKKEEPVPSPILKKHK